MTTHRWTMIVLFSILALAIAGCAASVPQEDYDQVVADLDNALAELTTLEEEVAATQSQVTDLEAELVETQAEFVEAQAELVEAGTDLSEAEAAEQELKTLQEKVAKAATSAEIMKVFLKVGFGAGGDLSEIDAMSVFTELSSMVEDSGDEALQEKFQAVLFSFGGEQEALDLVEYMLGTITSLQE